jgi:hypothetical protein
MESTGNRFERKKSEKKHGVIPSTDEKASGEEEAGGREARDEENRERKSVILVPSK